MRKPLAINKPAGALETAWWHTDGSFRECGHAEPATIPAVLDAYVTHSLPEALVQQLVLCLSQVQS